MWFSRYIYRIAFHLPNDLISKGISINVAGWSLAIIGLLNIWNIILWLVRQ